MRPLIINETSRLIIAETIKYAEKNKISKPFLMAAMNGKMPCPGDNPNYCCYFEVGYKVVFTVEEQPCGWCKHISVSVASPKKDVLPNVESVKLIMQEFGMDSLEESNLYIEDSFPKSINVICKC